MHIPSLSTVAVGLLVAANAVSAKKPNLTWDAAYKKADALVSQMSLEQQVNITTGVGWMAGLCVGNTYPITKPDFPALCLEDGPLGIRFGDNVTAGITGINSAATWDRDLMRQRGEYLGQEFHDKGIHVQLGPGVNFMRNPEGGRGWESGGEDPFLQGVTASEQIIGVQSEGVIATAKHYILNDQELNRKNSSSNVDDKTLHEIYLWPYARAVEAGVGSIMCSYNQLDDVWACESDHYLNKILKDELGFKGFVQSDWSATMSTVPSANGGLDMTMPGDVTFQSGDSYFGKNLTDAVDRGDVEAARVKDMAKRIVAAWYKVGQDKDFPETTINAFNRDKAPYNNVQRNHKKVAYEGAVGSAVLLSNKGVLPLSNKVKKVAVIGSDAGQDPNGLNTACADHGCLDGTLAQGWGSGTTDYPYLIDPLTGLKSALGKKVSISSSLNDWDIEAAKKAAAEADVAFVFSNADSGEEYIDVDGNVGDRKNITLWHNGDALIKAVADVNKNTVVVIHSVGAVLMPWANHPNIKAILWPGVPGQESGNAFADIVTGKRDPSGRLPYTIAKEYDDYLHHDPAFEIDYKEGLLFGYRAFDAHNIKPLFPFGHGLSYTKFDYSKLKLKTKGKGDSVQVTATVTISNTGAVDGSEVVQAYIGFPKGNGEPPKVLRGFEKIVVKKGHKENVDISFSKTELSVWNADSKKWVIPSGTFTLYIGASSGDIRQTATFKL